MLNVPSMQVLGISGSLVAVLGLIRKGLVTVGAVIMLATDPAAVTSTEAVLPDASVSEARLIKLRLLPIDEESG